MIRKTLQEMTRKHKIAFLLFLFSFIVLIVSKLSPQWAHWYSTNIYPILVISFGIVWSLFPFSVSEIALYFLLFFCLYHILYRRRKRKQHGYRHTNVLLLLSILFFLYVINCGINYYRIPFVQSNNINIKEYSVEELKVVCQWLTTQVNIVGEKVIRNEEEVMILSSQTHTQAIQAMKKLGTEYPVLAGYYPKPKGLLFPWILSIQQISGIYSPFTIEANYNSVMIDYNIPFTICHELSHVRGFMQEEEANFIAFLACITSQDLDFQYSGYLVGWSYCMNALYRVDYDGWKEIRTQLSDEVQLDIHANNAFWAKYDGFIAQTANQVNDSYLKANGQENGVTSYQYIVDLIVSYYFR